MPEWLRVDLLLPLSELLTVLGFLLALLLLAQLLRSNRPPQSTIAWVLSIVLIPYIGVPLYMMLGGRKMRRMEKRKGHIYHRRRRGESGFSDGELSGTERILATYGIPPSTLGNRVELITSGVEAYRRVMELIEGAQRSIHITTYILGRDAVGEAVVARLAKRAREGVEVRLLLDDVGSWRVSRRFVAPLVEAGGKVANFMPVLHIPFRGRANLRDHRKLLVADGRVALTGGMNLAVEYMGPVPDPARWVDLLVRLEGPAAADLDGLFWSDWSFTTNEVPPPPSASDSGLAPAPEPEPDPDPSGPTATRPGEAVQVVASGPDVEGDPLYESLISLLFAARERVWVVTPYFVPDEILVRGLDLAARRGVDVRILVPAQSNHVTADLARVGYLRQVDLAGGRVLRYEPSMVHAKAVLIDRDLAIVGSANMDMRSLFLNYEVALFLTSRERVREVEVWFTALTAACRPGLARPTWALQLAENVVRLLSPLL